MIVCQLSDYLFYSTGKIATTSITTLPNANRLIPTRSTLANHNNSNYSLRQEAIKCINRLVTKNDQLNVVIVIREPRDRFFSGLYEIIAKQLYISSLIKQAELGVEPDIIQRQIEIMYDPHFWHEILLRSLLLRPQVWIRDKELQSIQWHFHLGNWLADANQVFNNLTSLQKSVKIVDISNLSSFFIAHGLPNIEKNKKENLFEGLQHLSDPYKNIANNTDSNKIYNSFISGYNMCHHTDHQRFDEYLEVECKIYKDLISKSVTF